MPSHLDRVTRALKSVPVALTIAVSGCAAHTEQPRSAHATLLAFASALNDGKLAAAYALMSDDYRKRVNLAAWQQSLQENAQEAQELSNTLARVRGPADEFALLHTPSGQELRLRRNEQGWAIVSDIVGFYDQSTPRAALYAFVRAMRHRRYDVVLRLMPDADKEGVTTETMEKAFGHEGRAEIDRLLSQLDGQLEAPIEIAGNRATMSYADHLRVQFVREAGRWRIEDPE